ncbi:MAG: SAM-dependent methyltransferase [Myxococcota bacterium]
MSYEVKVERHTFGGSDWWIRSLLDRCQYDDADGEAERRGIPAASWPYFGQVWAAGLSLADTMGGFDLHGRRVLEIGCGLALGGLVSHRRGADVTVSDRHPLTEAFLGENLRLNQLGPLPYRDLDWSAPHPTLGRFDVVIGSDLLYEPEHARDLARFADDHLTDAGAMLLVDPGRGRCAAFSRMMATTGFSGSDHHLGGSRTRILQFSRGALTDR